jgi:hypothetical protein
MQGEVIVASKARELGGSLRKLGMESTVVFLVLGILFALWLVAVGLSAGGLSTRIIAHHHHSYPSILRLSRSTVDSSAQRGLATRLRDHVSELLRPHSGASNGSGRVSAIRDRGGRGPS